LCACDLLLKRDKFDDNIEFRTDLCVLLTTF
jgi:hypothetical protein